MKLAFDGPLGALSSTFKQERVPTPALVAFLNSPFQD
jgi:hypothetical protein